MEGGGGGLSGPGERAASRGRGAPRTVHAIGGAQGTRTGGATRRRGGRRLSAFGLGVGRLTHGCRRWWREPPRLAGDDPWALSTEHCALDRGAAVDLDGPGYSAVGWLAGSRLGVVPERAMRMASR